MDIALVRVDNRLVHGQIIEGWVPYVRANCIFVVDDDVASDFFRETVIKMAVPRESIRSLLQANVQIEHRRVPREKPLNVQTLIKAQPS